MALLQPLDTSSIPLAPSQPSEESTIPVPHAGSPILEDKDSTGEGGIVSKNSSTLGPEKGRPIRKKNPPGWLRHFIQ